MTSRPLRRMDETWKPDEKKQMPAKKQPCIVNKIRYESETAAAKATKIGLMVLRSRLCSFHFPEYKSKYHKKVKRRRRISSISCTIRGVKYASLVAASKKFKVSTNAISNRLKSPNYPDYVSADVPKKPPKPIKYNYKVKGKKYRSLQEIADVEGVTKEWIRQKMNNPKYSGYQRL